VLKPGSEGHQETRSYLQIGSVPLKDIYKTLVFELCHWRNANRLFWMEGPDAPIPERIITRPPTAELAENQSDEKSLGSYPMLDAVLEQIIEHMQDAEPAAREASKKLGFEVTIPYAERIAKLVQRAEYKRRQAPPGIKLTSRSFGFGWRYPITNGN
jgi:NAD+ synthase